MFPEPKVYVWFIFNAPDHKGSATNKGYVEITGVRAHSTCRFGKIIHIHCNYAFWNMTMLADLRKTFGSISEDLSFIATVETWRLPIMILDRELNFVFANEAYLLSTEQSWENMAGRHVFDVFPDTPERVQHVHSFFEKCLSGTVTTLDAQPFNLKHKDGHEGLRYWQATQEPLRNQDGEVLYLVQYTEDVTERVQAQIERDLVAQELNHRVKNVLSVIQSIARLSSRGQTSVEDFSQEFIQRVGAMSRVHSRLYENEFTGTTLRHILIDELETMSAKDSEVFSLVGPEVALSANLSKDLSMVVHELATNAAKYGCFSKEEGKLVVTWTHSEKTTRIIWRETGSGKIENLSEDGFGSTLIRAVKNIDCDRTIIADGLEVSITLHHAD